VVHKLVIQFNSILISIQFNIVLDINVLDICCLPQYIPIDAVLNKLPKDSVPSLVNKMKKIILHLALSYVQIYLPKIYANLGIFNEIMPNLHN